MSFDRSSQKHFAFHSVSMEDARFVGIDEVFVLRKHEEYTGSATALKNLSRRYTGPACLSLMPMGKIVLSAFREPLHPLQRVSRPSCFHETIHCRTLI